MAYNLTLINGSGIVPLITSVNDVLMYGWYGKLTLITLFIILVMAYMIRTNNATKALAFASLITAFSSVLFKVLDLVSDFDVLIAWVLAGAFVAYSFMSDNT